MLWAVGYVIAGLPVAVFTGRWLADEPDYKNSPGMLGFAAIIGGCIWPLMVLGGVVVLISTQFGEWLGDA